MKIYRLQHNLETIINADFLALGVGVDYINYPLQGEAGKDTAKLYLSEETWWDIPLKALDNKEKFHTYPYGFKFSRPFVLQRGTQAIFTTNQNVSADDIHLLFYGHYLTPQATQQIQKKPISKIFLTGFDITSQSQKLVLPFAYLLLSIGFIYGKTTGGKTMWQELPDTIKGNLEIRERSYYFDDNQLRSFNLISDLFRGKRSVCNYYNLWGIRVENNEHILLRLKDTISGTDKLVAVIEYVRLTADITPRRVVEPASTRPARQFQQFIPKSEVVRPKEVPKTIRPITKFRPEFPEG